MRRIACLIGFAAALFFLPCLTLSLMSATTVDVMIVYDSTAKAWVSSHGGMNTFAADAVARMNQATANSDIDLTFRLVRVAEVSYTSYGDLGADLENLRTGLSTLSAVHDWRNKYNADLVTLLVGPAWPNCAGVGYILQSYDGDPNFGFSVSAIQYVDIDHTLTHEVGHNLGCGHSKKQKDDPGPNTYLNTYSAGWYFTGKNYKKYRTIMAYENDGFGNSYTEAPLFSTPLLSYQGTVAGHAQDGDNTRNIRQTMEAVAEYRSDSSPWKQKAFFTGSARDAAVGFSIGGKGYIGVGYGGLLSGYRSDFWEYDPAANTWTQKADFGGTARDGTVGFSIGAKGYIGTGSDGSHLGYKKEFWEYDPAANTWTQKADFGGTARSGAVGFSIGSKGYIGVGYDGSYRKDFWEYDPTVDGWVQKTSFGGTARDGAVGFSIGGKGYIGVGWNGFDEIGDFWEYNPTADKWTRKADFAGTARDGAVGFSIGGKGYIGVGYDGSYRKDFWEYDPTVDGWVQKTSFGGTARDGAVGFSIGGKGYIGVGYDGSYKKDFWEYDSGLTVDTTPPVIQITSPTSDPTYSTGTSTLNMSGTASDNVGVVQVTWVNNRGGSGTASGTASWSVNDIELSSGVNVITVTVCDAMNNVTFYSITVTYNPPNPNPHSVTAVKKGTGSGAVMSAPSGIACGSACTASYASGTAVTLTAFADSGSYFAGWGPPCSGIALCTFSVDADTQVAATFNPGYFDTVQKVYIGYYQRPADPGGLLYWAGRLAKTNGSLNEIIEAYANSDESRALYGTIDSSNISTVVNAIYKALFNRDAETEGLNWYVNGFNSGHYTAATIMLNVLHGAQNEDLQTIKTKLAAANLFTRAIDPELDGLDFQHSYAGDAIAQRARVFLSTVTYDPTTVPTEAEIGAFFSQGTSFSYTTGPLR